MNGKREQPLQTRSYLYKACPRVCGRSSYLYKPVRGEATASLERHSLSLASGLRPSNISLKLPLVKPIENLSKINRKDIEMNVYYK